MFLTSITSLIVALLCHASLSDARKNECGGGQFFDGKQCELCLPGTYQGAKRANKCKPCPAGTYNPYRGAHGIDICIDCPAGSFRDKPGATAKKDCKKCPTGQNAPVGSPKCISCPAGKVISACGRPRYHDSPFSFRGNCFKCQQGSFSSNCTLVGPIKLSCEDCFAGSTSNEKNSVECEYCPEGTTSQPGALKCIPEAACPSGSQPRLFGEGCSKCTFFAANDGKTGFCESCPPGFIGNSRTGAVKCVPCPSGTFRGEADFRCSPCKEGENTFVTGATFCVTDETPCPPNYFRTKTGACLRCTKRQRLDEKKKKCVDCPKNSVSEGGVSTKCKRCPKGTTTEEGDYAERCFCRPGWGFGDGLGINGGTCKKCPPGTESHGRYYCTECREGTFAPNSGMARCHNCPPGSRQPFKGQSKCIREPTCRKGLIRSENGVCVEPATNCPPNHRRVVVNEWQAPNCNPLSCPAGKAIIRTIAGYEICGVCRKGTRYFPKSKTCLQCGSGLTGDGGLSQVCKRCPKGEQTSRFGSICRCVDSSTLVNGECVRCPKGTFGYDNVGGCEPCPAGTFSEERFRDFAEECQNCPAGTFSGPGASSCKPCPKGTVSFGVGDSGCVRPGSLAD